MYDLCLEKNIPSNISCNEEERIYGPQWYHFINECKAMLGTESGSNIFDFDGSIQDKIHHFFKNNPPPHSKKYMKNFYKVLKKIFT
mgnify:FL=1